MKVAIRTDSSTLIGSGHLMRCFTLADMLREKGVEVSFVCRELPGNLGWLVREKGYSLFMLPLDGREPASGDVPSGYARWLGTDWATDANQTLTALSGESDIDWLIVDHYALDEEWGKSLRWRVGHIMVIDDLANRRHDCDLLLDQNFHENAQVRYEGLVPSHCRKLLGPQYALLRPEFLEARQKMPERSGDVNRILVFFGGSDVTNETTKALQAIRSVGRPDVAVDVIVGSSNPHKAQIETASRGMPNVTLHYQVENMAELMVRADLAIGGGGTTTWERCCLGLPTIIVAIADNQFAIGRGAERIGIGRFLGNCHEVTSRMIVDELTRLLAQPHQIVGMTKQGIAIVDGRGADLVSFWLLEQSKKRVVL
jgi:UDP-2,4-diacetamido-2,4,6-trideoxy-beta-L-altropyranose hydrolase